MSVQKFPPLLPIGVCLGRLVSVSVGQLEKEVKPAGGGGMRSFLDSDLCASRNAAGTILPLIID